MTPPTQPNSEIKRECPHCHGSLERYEDPKAVEIIAGCFGAIYAWWTVNPRLGCSLGWLYVAMLGWELNLRSKKPSNDKLTHSPST
jgi:hypothetical protein